MSTDSNDTRDTGRVPDEPVDRSPDDLEDEHPWHLPPTGIGESGRIIEEYVPGADARAAQRTGHLEGQTDVHAVIHGMREPGTVREDLNLATAEQRLQGIVVQMEADLDTRRLAPEAVRYVLEERLGQAGIIADDDEITRLTERIVSEAAPTDVEHGEPGATPRL